MPIFLMTINSWLEKRDPTDVVLLLEFPIPSCWGEEHALMINPLPNSHLTSQHM